MIMSKWELFSWNLEWGVLGEESATRHPIKQVDLTDSGEIPKA
jgi:hypothetical protein